MKVIINEKEHEILDSENGISFDGIPLEVLVNETGEGSFHFIYNDTSYRIIVEQSDNTYQVQINGKRISVQELSRLKDLMAKIGVTSLATDHVKELKAPMPGKILKVLVNNNDPINKTQGVIVLEAMKMENVLKSPVEGQIAEIAVSPGDTVEKDQILVTFEDPK
ncbi:MAG: biotin attachment protein [Flavobacteriales bacterium]|nr:biotin attachment protein [Flavobacteriales bacterium]